MAVKVAGYEEVVMAVVALVATGGLFVGLGGGGGGADVSGVMDA